MSQPCHFFSKRLPQSRLIQNDKLWNESDENVFLCTSGYAYEGIAKKIGKSKLQMKPMLSQKNIH